MFREFEMENTSDAERFAKAEDNSVKAVKMNLSGNMSTYRLEEWRKALDELVSSTGISLEEAALYAGLNSTGYYRRMPKARESFIALGMAFGADLDTINEWIVRFGEKKKLYIKNVLSDIVWIYLIEVNHRLFEEKGSERPNLYQKYDEVSAEIERVYQEHWDEPSEYEMTGLIEKKLRDSIVCNDESALVLFVENNMSYLRSAYLRPRKMIADYVTLIIDTVNKNGRFKRKWTTESLRGYLSDAQINYVSGDYTSSSALDRSGKKTSTVKSIPQGKKSHISLGLSLGMTLDEINEYLELMGYRPLDAVNYEEAQLINLLVKWEKQHYLQRALKDGKSLKPRDAVKAVDEMLGLMEDLKVEYESQQISITRGGKVSSARLEFPYSK